MIEIRRHKVPHKIEEHLRFCPFCQKVVENEVHFLIDCQIYKHLLRADLFTEIIRDNPLFQYFSKQEKFVFLMTNASQREIASFIYNSFELRNFLSMKPKRTE